MQINSIFKEFENLSVEKMTLSTALGFEPRSFEFGSFSVSAIEKNRRILYSPGKQPVEQMRKFMCICQFF